MTIPNKRVAVLSPVAWRTPPRQYGAWTRSELLMENNVDQAVQALKRLGGIDRCACRQRVQECFSIETMVKAY